MALTPEQQRELNALTLEEIRLKKELGELNSEELDYIDKLVQQREKNLDRARDQVATAEAYLERLQKIGSSLEANNLKHEAEVDLARLKKQEILLQLKNTNDDGEALAKNLKTIEKQLEALQKISQARNANNELLEYQTSLQTKVEQSILRSKQAFRDGTGPELLGKSLLKVADSGADAFLGRLTGAAKEAFFSFDELSKSFERQYAVGEDFKEQTRLLYKDLSELSVSMEDLTESAGALIDNFTDFTLQTKEQQKALRETAAVMEKSYGIAFEDFSKGLQVSTKMMGMSTSAAKNLSGELAATADALGVSIPGLVNQFASMGPSLAKFGTEGVKHFKELARISKLTGLEIEKLLSITEKFDTFEGAAERAGMLNAALGGNFVNAMDLMMTTDPAERFSMIRDAIDQTGLSFDEMGYYQKQFFAEAAGLEGPADLALLMSGNMDLLAGATNQSAESLIEQKQRAADLQSVMEKLQAVFVSLATSFDITTKSADFIADRIELIGKGFLIVVGAVKGLSIALGIYTAATLKSTAAKMADVAAGGPMATMTTAQTAALKLNTDALLENAIAHEMRNKQMAASKGTGALGGAVGGGAMATKAATIGMLAVAFIAFGAAIMMAAKGVDTMANALKGLNTEELDALTTIFVTLAGVMGAMAIGIVMVGKASEVSAAGMLALGASVALIGFGFKLAGEGIGALAEGFSTLADVGLGKFAVQLIAVSGAILLIAKALALMGNPLTMTGAAVLGGLGVAAAGIGAMMKFFKKDDNPEMEEMGIMFEKMGKVDLTGAKQAFNSIAQSVNRTDIDRLEGYTAVAKNLIVKNPVAAATTPQKMLPLAAGAAATGGRGSTTTIKHEPIKVDIEVNHPAFRAAVRNANNNSDMTAATENP